MLNKPKECFYYILNANNGKYWDCVWGKSSIVWGNMVMKGISNVSTSEPKCDEDIF